MRTFKPLQLTPIITVFDDGKRPHCVVTAVFMCDFDGRLGQDLELWGFAQEEAEGGLLDEGKPKPRAEYLVHGSCFTYQDDARVSFVKAEVSGKERTLAVFGRRTVSKLGLQSEPEPFREMPVRFANAYGGEGFADNPLGKGYRRGALPADSSGKPREMPNIERRDRLMTSPDDRPPPASFARLDATWPQRIKGMGTYDDRWLKTRYPGVAEDFDMECVMTAQPEQRFDAFLRGDEAFSFTNMHPDKPSLSGKLPNVVARCLLSRYGGALEDVPLRFDTLHFFPHRERVVVVMRGTTHTSSSLLADIDQIIVGLEWKDRPKPIDHYLEEHRRRSHKQDGMMASLDNAPLLPEGAPLLDAPSLGIEAATRPELFTADFLMRNANHELGQLHKRLEASGLDTTGIPREMAPLDKNPRDDDDSDPGESMKQEEAEYKAQLKDTLRVAAERAKEDPEPLLAKLDVPWVGPPDFWRRRQRQAWEEQATLCDNAGEPATAEVFRGMLADPEVDRQLQEMQDLSREGYRTEVQLQGRAPRLDGEGSERLRAEVTRLLAAGETLSELDLTGCDLSGMDLSGAHLVRGLLESANLTGCKLTGANLENAILARGQLAGVDFTEANVKGVSFTEAALQRSRFDGRDLTDALFVRTDMTGASLRGARIDNASFEGTTLDDVDLSGSVCDQVDLAQTILRDVNLEGATLKQASFLGATLERVRARNAVLEELSFVDSIIRSSDFTDANLGNLRAARIESDTTFEDCRFIGAQLERSHFRNCRFDRCDFSHARLAEADFSEAVLDGSSFHDARATGARFMGASLVRCDFRRADLLDGLLGGAKLEGARFEEANLFRADLAYAEGRDASMKGANVKHVRTAPKRDAS